LYLNFALGYAAWKGQAA